MENFSYLQLMDQQTIMFDALTEKKDIIRKDWFNFFYSKTRALLQEKTATISNPGEKIVKKVDLLVKRLNDVNENIMNSNSSLKRFVNEIELDVVNRFLEEHTTYAEENKLLHQEETDFKYYPEYSDKDFNKKIYEKKEFYENKISLMTLEKIEKSRTEGRKRSQTQKFVKNYISKDTPYNGILLWHGVGVGKTCAAISIAENFKEFVYKNNKKILVLIPSGTLEENWKDEIFSVSKEIKKMINGNFTRNVQCTGNTYLKEFKDFHLRSDKQKRKMARNLINKYYEIKGYHSLANAIEKEFKRISKFRKKNHEKAKINYIKAQFSNRVIIMDEVHITRQLSESKNDKKASPYLEMIMRYADNCKVILLTATPMYNVSVEIIWLLNLLLWNDNAAPLESFLLFENPKKDGIQLKIYEEEKKSINQGAIPYSLKRLVDKSKGYISYLRGENPFVYPYKLYPRLEDGGYTPSPKLISNRGSWTEIDEESKIPSRGIKFMKNSMSKWQFKELIRLSKTEKLTKDGFNSDSIQGSNIIYPTNQKKGKNFRGIINSDGIDECFTIENEKYTYKPHVNNINGKTFLHIDNVGNFSKKIETILNCITQSKGIVYVYSNYIKYGIKPLALALEENGFSRYVGNEKTNNFLTKKIPEGDKFCSVNKKYKRDLKTPEEKRKFRQAKYIFLDGYLKKKDLSNLVRESRGEATSGKSADGKLLTNDFGEHIMVILGSKVIEQGVSFFGIREIHIMDPWWHLNMLEQAAGRGFRNFSHFGLDKKYRNLTLYLHIATLPDSNHSGKETSDERMYRIAYYKKREMSIIERQLKKNAVDCALNRMGNIFLSEFYSGLDINPLTNIEMEDSRGRLMNINISDEDYSLKCDLDVCNYKCDWQELLDEPDNIVINEDTFNEGFANDDIEYAKELIKSLFIDETALSESDIINTINVELNQGINETYIYIALDNIVENKELVSDIYGRPGYIIGRNGIYIFQPKDITDTDISMYYRIKTPNSKTIKFPITNYPNNELHINTANRRIFKKKKSGSTNSKKTGKSVTDNIRLVNSLKGEIEKVSNYIITEYNSDYPSERDSSNTIIPTLGDLITQKTFQLIDELNSSTKIQLLSITLTSIINKMRHSKGIDAFEQLILDYFDMNPQNTDDKSFSIFREWRDYRLLYDIDPDDSVKNEPKYFRIIENDGKQRIFEYSEDIGTFQKVLSLSPDQIRKLTLNNEQYEPVNNNARVYGYLRENKRGESKFYVVNRVNYNERRNKDGTVQKKSIRNGALCGQAKSCKEKAEIKDTINYVIDPTGKFLKYTSIPNYNKKKTKSKPGRSLCEELELLLRYRQYIRSPDEISNSIYWFYTKEQFNTTV